MSSITTSRASRSTRRSRTEPNWRPLTVRTSQPRISGSPSDTCQLSNVLSGTSPSRSAAYGPTPAASRRSRSLSIVKLLVLSLLQIEEVVVCETGRDDHEQQDPQPDRSPAFRFDANLSHGFAP